MSHILGDYSKSYNDFYKKCYENDIPIIISCDSIMCSLNAFYFTSVKELEKTLEVKLEELCKKALQTIYSINRTDKNAELLKGLEVIFLIPYLLLNCNENIRETDTRFTFDKSPDIDEWLKIYLLVRADKTPDTNKKYDDRKLERFVKKYFKSMDTTNKEEMKYFKKILSNKKCMDFYDNCEFGIFKKSIRTLYNKETDLLQIIYNIQNHIDMKMYLNFVEFYINSRSTSFYMQSIDWFYSIGIKIDSDNNIMFLIVLAKICENVRCEILYLHDIFCNIYGKPSENTICNFFDSIREHIPRFRDLDSVCYWAEQEYSKNHISKKILLNINEKYRVSIFDTKGKSFDEMFIECAMGDIEYLKIESNIYDVIYTIFDNIEASNIFLEKIKNTFDQGDISNYIEYIDRVKVFMDEYRIENDDINNQYFLTIRALSKDIKCFDICDIPNFGNAQWKIKQIYTQICQYIMLKSKTSFSFDKSNYICSKTNENIFIEPVICFWKELLKLINNMDIILDSKDATIILNKYKEVINDFLRFSEDYIYNDIINTEIQKKYNNNQWYNQLNVYTHKKTSINFIDKKFAGFGEIKHIQVNMNNIMYFCPIAEIYTFSLEDVLNNTEWTKYKPIDII